MCRNRHTLRAEFSELHGVHGRYEWTVWDGVDWGNKTKTQLTTIVLASLRQHYIPWIYSSKGIRMSCTFISHRETLQSSATVCWQSQKWCQHLRDTFLQCVNATIKPESKRSRLAPHTQNGTEKMQTYCDSSTNFHFLMRYRETKVFPQALWHFLIWTG